MKKRLLSIIFAAVLLTGLLAGCRKQAEPEVTPTATPGPTVDPHEGQVEVTNGAGGTIWVDEAEDLTPFSLDRYSFSVTDQIPNYAKDDATLVRGVDVSEYQGEIDWQAVADYGIEFAMIRVGWRGYGGGSLNPDALYRENIEGAQAAGLKVGAYFFSQAVSLMEAAEEAVYTAELLEGYTLELPVFFDWETIGTEPARTDGTSARMVTDCCLEFCKLLESEGYDVGVYTYIPVVYNEYVLNDLAGLSVWMGDPGNWPEFYYEHDYWQYSFTAIVPGIEGEVDLDVMYVPGTSGADTAAATPAAAETTGAEPTPVLIPAAITASETEEAG